MTAALVEAEHAPSRSRSGPPSRPSRAIAVTTNVPTPASARRSIASSTRGPRRRRPSRRRAAMAVADVQGDRDRGGAVALDQGRRPDPDPGAPTSRGRRERRRPRGALGDRFVPDASGGLDPRPAARPSPAARTIASSDPSSVRAPLRAPSRSTTWIQRAPSAAKRLATADGIVAVDPLAIEAPCSRRTTRPPRRSIAGSRSNVDAASAITLPC